MSWVVTYVRSSIGAKHIMAITGLLLVLFAIAHMAGHFGMFAGRDAYNAYAHFLQGLGALKWAVRFGLLFLVVVHIVSGLRLAALNAAARPVKYRVYRTARTKPWSKGMAWTGLAILAFIIYHLLHFTVGIVQPEYFHQLDPQGRYDAYVMFVRGFQQPAVLASYLIGMTLLLPHLMHGISSLFQSLGLKHPKYDRLIEGAGPALGLIIYLGYIAPPIAVALDIIKLPGA
jgi:succinate dehydrogenase / fumarate reductase, cytochrome b subunit